LDKKRLNLEIKILKNTYHYNIIKLYDVIETNDTICMIMEYAEGGELFNYVLEKKHLSEDESRRIFQQIIDAIYYLHQIGVCHRDLKLENILMNENNEPILCDFGFSGEIKGEDGTGRLVTFVGTNSYACPEILRCKPYDGIKCDIFSLGVILFILCFKCFGFGSALPNDYLYRLIIKKRYDQYWEEVGKKIGKEKINNISPELKALILKMISFVPNERPSIEDILNEDCMKNV
jgi:serine/threonine protein kinase